jgi:hypothetical protein
MSDRLREALEGVVSQIMPRIAASLAVYMRWEYTVAGVTPGPPVLISGVPASTTCPFGPLANITLWPGADGGYAIPAPGSLVLVEFHDGSPAKPAVCGLDPNVPPLVTFLGGGVVGQGVARLADQVHTIVAPGQLIADPSSGAVTAVPGAPPLAGTITSASVKVVSG